MSIVLFLLSSPYPIFSSAVLRDIPIQAILENNPNHSCFFDYLQNEDIDYKVSNTTNEGPDFGIWSFPKATCEVLGYTSMGS